MQSLITVLPISNNQFKKCTLEEMTFKLLEI